MRNSRPSEPQEAGHDMRRQLQPSAECETTSPAGDPMHTAPSRREGDRARTQACCGSWAASIRPNATGAFTALILNVPGRRVDTHCSRNGGDSQLRPVGASPSKVMLRRFLPEHPWCTWCENPWYCATKNARSIGTSGKERSTAASKKPRKTPGQHRAKDLQASLCTPVDGEHVARRPDRRTEDSVVLAAPRGLGLRDESPQVPRESDISGRSCRR